KKKNMDANGGFRFFFFPTPFSSLVPPPPPLAPPRPPPPRGPPRPPRPPRAAGVGALAERHAPPSTRSLSLPCAARDTGATARRPATEDRSACAPTGPA